VPEGKFFLHLANNITTKKA